VLAMLSDSHSDPSLVDDFRVERNVRMSYFRDYEQTDGYQVWMDIHGKLVRRKFSFPILNQY
jgi:hypothetical protein